MRSDIQSATRCHGTRPRQALWIWPPASNPTARGPRAYATPSVAPRTPRPRKRGALCRSRCITAPPASNLMEFVTTGAATSTRGKHERHLGRGLEAGPSRLRGAQAEAGELPGRGGPASSSRRPPSRRGAVASCRAKVVPSKFCRAYFLATQLHTVSLCLPLEHR